MRLHYLKPIAKSREIVENFRGYNHNMRIGENEFYDMENMTGDFAPVLSPRGKRGVYAQPQNPQGLIAKDALCYVDGEDFVIGDYRVPMGLSTKKEDCPKQLIAMGAYVIILPDAKWINTAKWEGEDGKGEINVSNTTTLDVTFSMCTMDGKPIKTDYVQAEQPSGEGISNGQMWVDTSGEKHIVKQYSASSGLWVGLASTYIKITSPGIGKGLKQYDGIELRGLDGALNQAEGSPVGDTAKKQLAALNGFAIVYGADTDFLIIPGILDGDVSIMEHITAARQMPLMDFVVESGNRLWGCRYGLSREGKVVNEIYASKLGDFKNWRCYMGISTDSYAVSLGTDGPFTGAISMDYPIFFKETCLHKVFGNQPANYKTQVTSCRGVQKGCHKSLAIVNEVLFYKARNGVCAYDGSLPALVSAEFGERAYSGAAAGALGSKYYISMMDDMSKTYSTFVYDTAKRIWHREDSLQADDFCAVGQEMYAIEHGSKKIITMRGSGTKDDAVVQWMAETGDLTLPYPDSKYISRVIIRMSMELGSIATISIQYMGGQWETVATVTGKNLRSFSLPVRPKRCDHFRMKIAGTGDVKIYSITKEIEQGSDIT